VACERNREEANTKEKRSRREGERDEEPIAALSLSSCRSVI